MLLPNRHLSLSAKMNGKEDNGKSTKEDNGKSTKEDNGKSTKEDNGKSMKNAWYALRHAKRHISGRSDTEQ